MKFEYISQIVGAVVILLSVCGIFVNGWSIILVISILFGIHIILMGSPSKRVEIIQSIIIKTIIILLVIFLARIIL